MAEPDVMVYPDSGKVGIFGVRAVVGMFADGPSMGDPYPPWASFSAPQVFSTGFPIVEPVRGSPTVLARATRQHHLDVQIRRAESSVRGPGVQSTGTRGTKYGDPGYKVRGPGVQSTGTRGTKYETTLETPDLLVFLVVSQSALLSLLVYFILLQKGLRLWG